jgi:aconitate hydratase
MGILPLQFINGQNAQTLGLSGQEVFSITGIEALKPKGKVKVTATGEGKPGVSFDALVRVDTSIELEYYRYGGILSFVLRQMLAGKGEPVAA